MSPAVTKNCCLGIDIGSVSIGYVLMDPSQQILKSEYLFHQGNIFERLKALLAQIDLSRVYQVAYNHKAGDFFAAGMSVNEQVALIEGIRYQQPEVRSLFTIGGETFGLILFDKNNQYQKYISNSSCAAGTGGFLDQQAERLGLAGSAELGRLADSFRGEPPKIATRCAVFAKTDLTHCQQQGYSLAAISAGLCQGLAHNIVDTLVKGVAIPEPVAVVGGVSQNVKVMHYLAELIGCSTVIPEQAVLTGAIGCALVARPSEPDHAQINEASPASLLKKQTGAKHYFFPPLKATRSVLPDFTDHVHYVSHGVEVDLYHLPSKKGRMPVYFGLDIGSTSTKAVLTATGREKEVLLGLYTRTRGQPITATQALLRVLREIEERYGLQFEFRGAGTTGSGRKFIQKVIKADLAIDEITAHARAAYALNPDVDTIIEIGGQDSKFTVMRNGRVTFSVMNYVCAAGTGSFIEEQAKRLDVPLAEYAGQAGNASAPLTSDRCTVFMERDLNHFLSQGYAKPALLAAALHSVRDNYLSKVAHLNKIGAVICFQGATAKNQALVAAFEQKLGKPIVVSRYCHLTGALGVCLLLAEKQVTKTGFRGIDFYRERPAVTEEICDLCQNHCKLKRVQLAGDSVMWGFLCGRDESTARRKSANQSGFDLLSSRRRVFAPPRLRDGGSTGHPGHQSPKALLSEIRLPEIDLSLDRLGQRLELNLLNLRHKLYALGQEDRQALKAKNEIVIGLPNALHMVEFMPFWRLFFEKLGYHVCPSSPQAALVAKGKEIAQGEFCAPIAYWHGHVQDLSRRSDYLFLPQLLQEAGNGESRFYCYYSNYAVALLQNIGSLNLDGRAISPLIDFSKPAIDNVHQIYESLPQALKLVQTPGEIREAYLQAWRWFTTQKEQFVEIFRQQLREAADISVVLLGRPYLVLDRVMNKDVPRKFNEFGIKTFFQEMLPQIEIGQDSPAREFADWNHWKYGADILQAAEYVGRTQGLYPVYLSAFKCSPDSFLLSYFKEIMDRYQKPYLILQIDEHGSNVGYETRVEAAVETFRSHFQGENAGSAVRKAESDLRLPLSCPRAPVALEPNFPAGVVNFPAPERTILIPNFDPLSCYLIGAIFEQAGYQARLIEESPTTVLASLRLNDGECLPISSIVQGAIETIGQYHLGPEQTTIFMPAISQLACNFPQYPLLIKKLLEQRGGGFEKVQIWATDFVMSGFPFELRYDLYCAFLFGGLLRRMACRLRPYEMIPGQTDLLVEQARHRLYRCLAGGESKEQVFQEIVADFSGIPVNRALNPRPKVAIIGDLYVRDNDVFNQQLVAALEDYGAEVVAVPFNYVLRLLAYKHTHYLWQEGQYMPLIRDKLLLTALEKFEKRFYQIAGEVLGEGFPTFDDAIFDCLPKYGLSLDHGGETAQNLLKIFTLLNHHPDLSLFIHVNPIFCCPGLVSEALFKVVEKDIDIPIVSIVYDGTTTNKNDLLAPYLHYLLRFHTGRKINPAVV